jgi:DNA helicase-2/ATP-dependent DNA helicase PcrA
VFHKSWKSEGFLSREHEKKRIEAGEQALRKFYDKEEAAGIMPAFIEKDFSFLVNNDRIKGRWDRIDIRNGDVVVVDFKSSEVRQQKDADRKTKESLQLAIYSLAYQDIHGQTPSAMELHFLDTELIGRADITEKILGKAVDNITEACRGIRARDYTAKPDYMNCKYCAYEAVCPAKLTE